MPDVLVVVGTTDRTALGVHHDEDACETTGGGPAMPLRQLLGGFSYSASWLESAVEAATQLDLSDAAGAMVLYDVSANAPFSPGQALADGRCLGRFAFRRGSVSARAADATRRELAAMGADARLVRQGVEDALAGQLCEIDERLFVAESVREQLVALEPVILVQLEERIMGPPPAAAPFSQYPSSLCRHGIRDRWVWVYRLNPTTPTVVAISSRAEQRVDPIARLTTGSVAERLAAAHDEVERSRERVFKDANTWRTAKTIPDPVGWQSFAAAIASPANAGGEFDDLRAELYVLSCRFRVPEQGSFLADHVRREPEEVRLRVYRELPKVALQPADRLLAEAFCRGTEAEAQAVGQVVWRSDGAIEILVRDHLISAWEVDPPLARRIIELFEEECIRIPHDWLTQAPAALIRTLGPQIATPDEPT